MWECEEAKRRPAARQTGGRQNHGQSKSTAADHQTNHLRPAQRCTQEQDVLAVFERAAADLAESFEDSVA